MHECAKMYHHKFNKPSKHSHIKFYLPMLILFVKITYVGYIFKFLCKVLKSSNFQWFSSQVKFWGVTNLPPLKRISSSRFEMILEQIGKFLFKIIFSFPCGFCLCMVTPFYLIEPHCYPSGLSGDYIQYLNQTFLILQIWL